VRACSLKVGGRQRRKAKDVEKEGEMMRRGTDGDRSDEERKKIDQTDHR
jgi:hypothetical protein